MGLKNKDGVDMKEVWKDGVFTYLGTMTAGFPNMFMVFTPQGEYRVLLILLRTLTDLILAPTALTNGPTILECQVDFAIDAIKKLEAEGAKSLEPLHSAEVEWKERIGKENDSTLLKYTESWWTGGNIPGKKSEPLSYIGGVDKYEEDWRSAMAEWKGFQVVKA